MHETSLVAELVGECERRAGGHRVTRVRVRHASSLEDGALRAIFGALTADGPLAQAILETEEFDAVMICDDCGYSGAVDHNHVYGHIRICPNCDAICDDAGAPEIELVGVELDDS